MAQKDWDIMLHKVNNVRTLRKLRNLIKKRKQEVLKNPSKTVTSTMNTGYRQWDWSKKLIKTSQAKEILKDPFYKCWRRIVMDGQAKPVFLGNYRGSAHYNSNNIQGLCLMKQIAALQQSKYYRVTPKKKKVQKFPYTFDSAYIGEIVIFWYPKSKQWKLPIIKQWLEKREYLFDQQNPFYKGIEKTRIFCKDCLLEGKIEKWDYYLQRFLSKGDK